MININDKICQAIKSLHLQNLQVDVQGNPPAIFVTIVSDSFNDMNEAERQKQVWDSLRRYLNEDERAVIEFVFTVASDDSEVEDE